MMRPLLGALVLALLSACASQPDTTPEAADWTRTAASLAALENWAVKGKLALRGPEQSETAGFHWQQRADWTELELSGPVGLNATRLSSDGLSLVIERDGERELYDISSPDAIRRSTGWDLPLAALPYWLRGLPEPDSPVEDQALIQGRLQQLRQLGWLIEYQAYERIDELALPTRLTLSRDETRLRLVIRKWELP